MGRAELWSGLLLCATYFCVTMGTGQLIRDAGWARAVGLNAVLLLGYLVVNDRAAGEGYVGGGDCGRMGVRGNLQASRSVAAVGRGWGGGIRPRGGV